MNVTDSIPIESAAKLSLHNVLTNVQFRNKHGFKLTSYQIAEGNKAVVLEYATVEKSSRKGKGK
jgi:hypothetical protein